MKISEVFDVSSSKRVLKKDWKSKGIPFYRGREVSALSREGYVDNELFISEELYASLEEKYGVPKAGDILITAIGTIGNTYVVQESDQFYFKDGSILRLSKKVEVDDEYVNFWFQSDVFRNQLAKGNGATVDTLTIEKLSSMEIYLPPIKEQLEIIANLKEYLSLEKELLLNSQSLQKLANDFFDSLVSKEVQDLVNEFGNSSMGEIFKIARGGSPRPIKSFLTNEIDGINWIKIGDATRSGKYIDSTREKIKPSGASRSRRVFEGDLLLSNSMSFGRPYILKTDGCIHDGWVVLTANGEVDSEFAYYLLGSIFMKNQFQELAQGSTVQNLNIELISRAIMPVPPIEIQRQLVESFHAAELAVEALASKQSATEKSILSMRAAKFAKTYGQAA